jgi:hypothetical protein
MSNRQNTIVCTFDATSPRITAREVHEWVFAALKIPGHNVLALQVDVIKRQVYVKLRTQEQAENILSQTQGQVSYTYPHGERYPVTIEMAGLGQKKLRVANLPPEIANEYLRTALSPYGHITDIQNEKWAQDYRYPVDNGVRVVHMQLKQHAPSYLTVAGQRILISYDGQPATCYGCGMTGHLIQMCPSRRRRDPAQHRLPAPTYSGAVKGHGDVIDAREDMHGAHRQATDPTATNTQSITPQPNESDVEPTQHPTTQADNIGSSAAPTPAHGNTNETSSVRWTDMDDNNQEIDTSQLGTSYSMQPADPQVRRNTKTREHDPPMDPPPNPSTSTDPSTWPPLPTQHVAKTPSLAVAAQSRHSKTIDPRRGPGTTNINPTDRIPSNDNRHDTNTAGSSDGTITHSEPQGAVSDTATSPKRKKKLKIEVTGSTQRGRSRSEQRRNNTKDGT